MVHCNEINERRSVRFFRKSKKGYKENIVNILNAAILAPSAKNRQPWRFFVVEGTPKEFVNFFSENKWIRTASFFIVVYMVSSDDIDRDKDVMAVGAAIENMLLEAQAEKMSSCWIGECFNNSEQINEWTGIKDAQLMAVVAFGYGREGEHRSKRKKMEEIVYNWEGL